MPEPSQPPPLLLYKHTNEKIPPIKNIASYYLNHLATPEISIWHTKGGSITQTIKHIGLHKHHISTVKIMWIMVNECKEKGVQ